MTDDRSLWRNDFESAMGMEFGGAICPPIPSESASPHECLEVLWEFLGDEISPTDLSVLDEIQLAELAQAFGTYFEAPAPTVDQIRTAVARTLNRWPPGSEHGDP